MKKKRYEIVKGDRSEAKYPRETRPTQKQAPIPSPEEMPVFKMPAPRSGLNGAMLEELENGGETTVSHPSFPPYGAAPRSSLAKKKKPGGR